MLADDVGVYQQPLEVSGKRVSSVEKEKGHLRHWSKQLGHLRLNKIRPHHRGKMPLARPAPRITLLR